MARGGARPYRKGAEAERRVQKALEANGYLVTRQPKSQSPYDLMAMDESGCVHLIQVKSKGYLPPGEKDALVKLALAHPHCISVLAWIEKNTLKRCRLINGGTLADMPCPR
jgi:hypothetical protein